MMGIPITALYEMTEYEFYCYRQGFRNKEIAEWERTRFLAWITQAVQSTKPLKIEEVLPLPIDKKGANNESVEKKPAKVSKKVFDHHASRLGIKV